MSLLMRRRSTQALEKLSDDSLISNNKGPAIPPMTMPDNYDPRIRGKIVHDFSAPRTRRNFSYNDIDSAESIQHVPRPWTGNAAKSADGKHTRRPQSADHYSPINHDREHTPVFREHFEEGIDSRQRGSAIRAEELANSDFLARNANLVSEEDLIAGPSSQTRRLPPPPLSFQESSPTENVGEAALASDTQLPTVLEASPIGSPLPQDIAASRSPPKARSRAPSATDSGVQPTRQPKHHTSNASRFSFQMMDKDSIAQEKLLEDKHWQHLARKQQERPSEPPDPYEEGLENIDDYSDIEDSGFYEEPIPGVNADVDEEDLEQASQRSALAALGISLSNMGIGGPVISLNSQTGVGKPFSEPGASHAVTNTQLMEPDRRDEKENMGPVLTRNFSLPVQQPQLHPADENEENGQYDVEGKSAVAQPANSGFDDDMYFDDGLIDAPGLDDDEKFDESVFDDPSHPLYERKPVSSDSGPRSEVMISDVRDSLALEPVEEEYMGVANTAIGDKTQKGDQGNLNVPHNSIKEHRTGNSHGRRTSGPHTYPPRNDLAAYHSALAEATHKAAAEGKFARHDSVSSEVGDEASQGDEAFGPSSRPSLIPDDGRLSQDSDLYTPARISSMPSKTFDEADYDTDDLDGYLEDDPIIAAANAEALASDDDGFYGQEFGFYAHDHGSEGAEFTNGGYFGPRGLDALGRSTSGRNAVREPNLTPITERSEFSTRNSFISLHSHWGPPSATSAALPSPGLAQLARLSPYAVDEDEMTLSQLMKLRRGAFGGSNGSLHSVSNSPGYPSPIVYPASAGKGSSPMVPSASAPGVLGLAYGNPEGLSPATSSRHGSQSLHGDSPLALAASDLEFDTESPSPSPLSRNSPTVTAASAFVVPPIPEQSISEESEEEVAEAERALPPASSIPSSHVPATASPLAMVSPPPNGVTNSPYSTSSSPSAYAVPSSSAARKPRARSSSGTADRLTYVHELPDRSNGYADRWVLERRRTAETGELELVGREIVSGGRI